MHSGEFCGDIGMSVQIGLYIRRIRSVVVRRASPLARVVPLSIPLVPVGGVKPVVGVVGAPAQIAPLPRVIPRLSG